MNLMGLSLVYSDPLWLNARGADYPVITDLTGYTHTIAANGGYESAGIKLKCSKLEAEEWIAHGLGRDIKVYNNALEQIFHCFVNKLSINIGGLNFSYGPLTDVINQALVAYTPVYGYSNGEAVTGTETVTPIGRDLLSQARYGVWEAILSGGQLLDDGVTDEAQMYLDAVLMESKNPQNSHDFSISTNESMPEIELECLGYSAFLDHYTYNAADSGSITFTTKLLAVLNGNPNTFLRTGYDTKGVTVNSALTMSLEDKYRTARSIIEEIVSAGDVSFQRWIFGMGKDLSVYYHVIPSTIDYFHSVTSDGLIFTDVSGNIIQPVDIKPGRWLMFQNFLSGKDVPTDYDSLLTDPRAMFIESINFSAPYGLSLTGNRISRVSQRLAQRGAI